jgi:hypothetical protein
LEIGCPAECQSLQFVPFLAQELDPHATSHLAVEINRDAENVASMRDAH